MILPESRNLEWIEKAAKDNNASNPILVEKVIRAFSLLEALARSGCPFIFKGGSSLMLHFGSSRRLSIDIDIICPPGTNIVCYMAYRLVSNRWPVCFFVDSWLFCPQISMSHQALSAKDLVGVAVGNDKEVVGNSGDGVIVVISDDDTVVLDPFPDHGLHVFNIYWVNLGKGFVQDVERSVAMQHKI